MGVSVNLEVAYIIIVNFRNTSVVCEFLKQEIINEKHLHILMRSYDPRECIFKNMEGLVAPEFLKNHSL